MEKIEKIENTENYKFKVDLKGIIRLLSDNLYSNDSVFLRELLQNAVDAISARKLQQPEFADAQITVMCLKDEQRRSVLEFHDNGIGLTKNEIHEFLSIIGRSSKSATQDARNSFIGQFGIGLLSCFLVADTIEVLTKSANSTYSYKWYGKNDGTYTILENNDKAEQGTEVRLVLSASVQDIYDEDAVEESLKQYGYLIPTPITLISEDRNEVINDNYIPWRSPMYTAGQVLEFGEELFEKNFLDAIPLTGDELEGYAFVLPHRNTVNSRGTHKIYLKDMYITDDGKDLVPQWAFFVQCVINAKNITPTASREGFYKNNKLLKAKAQVEQCILEYFIMLSKFDNQKLKLISQIHNLAMKSLVVDNNKIFQILFPFLSFRTSKGDLTGEQILIASRKTPIFYCSDIDQYRKMSAIIESRGHILINAGYTYDSTILDKICRLHPNVKIKCLIEEEIAEILQDISPEDNEAFEAFVAYANQALKTFHCKVQIKRFKPKELPSLFVAGDSMQFVNDMERIKNHADEDVSFFMEEFDDEYFEADFLRLYLNLNNEMIQRVCALKDEELIETIIQVIYVQALMLGHHRLENKDMSILNKNLTKLIELGLA